MMISGSLLFSVKKEKQAEDFHLPASIQDNPGGSNFAVAGTFRKRKCIMYRQIMRPYFLKKIKASGLFFMYLYSQTQLNLRTQSSCRKNRPKTSEQFRL